jgi:uncharacterized protein (TIGR02145 family)
MFNMNHPFLISVLFFVGFTDLLAQSIRDIDGNVYKTVQISTQVWMAENLKTTKYNDGTPIPLVTDGNKWKELTTPAYCWYKNDAATYKNLYGALYNWYVVDADKLCPQGWHVPTDEDWTKLTTYLGGEGIAGGKLKVKGTEYWEDQNTGATNESGFSALPGGKRHFNGNFEDSGSIDIFRSNGCWWSSTEVLSSTARYRRLYSRLSSIYSSISNKNFGYSVRCLKD